MSDFKLDCEIPPKRTFARAERDLSGAHIVLDGALFVCEKSREGQLPLPDAFWNVCFRDHDLFHHIVKMKGYGLPNLQKMLAALYADPRFYDENGELAPWSFTVPEE